MTNLITGLQVYAEVVFEGFFTLRNLIIMMCLLFSNGATKSFAVEVEKLSGKKFYKKAYQLMFFVPLFTFLFLLLTGDYSIAYILSYHLLMIGIPLPMLFMTIRAFYKTKEKKNIFFIVKDYLCFSIMGLMFIAFMLMNLDYIL